MMKINKHALENNKKYINNMNQEHDKKRIGSKLVNEFVKGDLVWFNIKRQLADLKKYMTH